jgi:hypothetical protein
MQVFITDPSMQVSASNLDSVRLHKQMIECMQLWRAIAGEAPGWRNHCVTRLWEKYPNELLKFAWVCRDELIKRGYSPWAPYLACPNTHIVPDFFNNDFYLSAMRSHLLSKDEGYYRELGWRELPIPGYWALNKEYQWQRYSE